VKKINLFFDKVKRKVCQIAEFPPVFLKVNEAVAVMTAFFLLAKKRPGT